MERAQNSKRVGGHAAMVVGIMAVVFGLIVLDCSGLNFPVMGKQASLAGGVGEDFGVALPASLQVVNAARVATRDPAYFYECEVGAGDMEKLFADLKAAGERLGYNVDSKVDTRISFGAHDPAWYAPAKWADIQRLKFQIPENGHHTSESGYWFFFSKGAGKVWVFWYST